MKNRLIPAPNPREEDNEKVKEAEGGILISRSVDIMTKVIASIRKNAGISILKRFVNLTCKILNVN